MSCEVVRSAGEQLAKAGQPKKDIMKLKGAQSAAIPAGTTHAGVAQTSDQFNADNRSLSWGKKAALGPGFRTRLFKMGVFIFFMAVFIAGARGEYPVNPSPVQFIAAGLFGLVLLPAFLIVGRLLFKSNGLEPLYVEATREGLVVEYRVTPKLTSRRLIARKGFDWQQISRVMTKKQDEEYGHSFATCIGLQPGAFEYGTEFWLRHAGEKEAYSWTAAALLLAPPDAPCLLVC